MLVEILVPRSSRPQRASTPLYTYRVPESLAPRIQPGHLVAVPFGSQTAAGIVWSLNAADEIARQADTSPAPREPLRMLLGLLLPEPVLLPAQLQLAEWIAGYYAAPLNAAVRPMLPPGLLRSVKIVIRALPETDVCATESLHPDEAAVFAMVREVGRLDRARVRAVFGTRRADEVLAALSQRGLLAMDTEIGESFVERRTERQVHLIADADAVARWQHDIRATLGAVATAAPPVATADRRTERMLRQLAVVDVLSRRAQAMSAAGQTLGWRLEDLKRLTRVTPAALAELERAGLLTIDDVPVRHDPLSGRIIPQTPPLTLTAAQSRALKTILDPDAPGGAVFLLHGITGSGKTEVYLQALAAVLARGQRAIVLVPEIALTPQATARFAGRFPGRVSVLHSGLTDAERLDAWHRIHAGEVDVVVGSRSALFAPVDRLGLIVLDEEHEAAYKEERTPTYHAREVARELAALTGARVILGSATPSLEAYWEAMHGRSTLIELTERPAVASPSTGTSVSPGLPPVEIIDLRAELRAGNTSVLGRDLHRALTETLERGEQAILFLNRRGTASSVVCRDCGFVVACTNCDVSMTLHAGERKLICHYCGKRESVPEVCPVCWSASIRYFGLGTERIESAVKQQFPSARVLRWDRDTARHRQAHEELLRAFSERRADVLVGTQMIAKGLDLPGVTLVGVVSADVALFLPDIRASERAFQLLTQVAGRAGRGERPGRVLIQTFNPDHFCIQAAAQHDYAQFVEAEVLARQRYGYPPFRRFVKCTFEHTDRYTAQIESSALAMRLERLLADTALADTDFVGPAPAFMERLRGRYRWQIILRSPDPAPLLDALTAVPLPLGWSIDVDPLSTL